MPRKSDQQLILEEQHRLWMGKLRKARTLQQQVTIQKIITGIEAKLWPDPAEEAKQVAAAVRLQLKAQKVAAAQAKKAEAAELERLKDEERRKSWEECNPVTEQLKRGRIQAEIATIPELPQLPDGIMVPQVELSPLPVTVEAEANSNGAAVVVSSEMDAITKAAETDALKQSTASGETRKASGVVSEGLLDMYRLLTRTCDGDEHDGSVGMTNALLNVYDHAPDSPEPVGEGGYMSDGMGGIKRG